MRLRISSDDGYIPSDSVKIVLVTDDGLEVDITGNTFSVDVGMHRNEHITARLELWIKDGLDLDVEVDKQGMKRIDLDKGKQSKGT